MPISKNKFSENTRRTVMDDREPSQPIRENTEPISSSSLLNGRAEIQIVHEGEIYRLRRTSKGKLIMTK